MGSVFDQFANAIEKFRYMSKRSGPIGFFGQEALRFYSIAGTINNIEGYSLDESAKIDERYMTHILIRSLLENYFCMLYLFDDPNQSQSRYDRIVSGFKRDYARMMNEPEMPHKEKLQTAGTGWSALQSPLDVKSMLAQVKNNYGDRLDYLYFTYRISSFDTHGKNMGAIVQSSFNKKINFPVLKIRKVIDLISGEYISILNKVSAAS